MKVTLGRRFVLAAAVIVSGCVFWSVALAATGEGQLSLPEIIKRVLDLEERVARIEKRLDGMEKPGLKPTQTRPSQSVIEILSPQDGDEVGMNVIVTGVVHLDDLAGRFPVVGVHPMLTSMTWIQPIPTKVEKTAEGFRFRTRVYCGTPKQGLGEQFELYALLPEKGALDEGDQLDRLPEDVPVSPSVLVTRVRN
jgi:hypothetical protein